MRLRSSALLPVAGVLALCAGCASSGTPGVVSIRPASDAGRLIRAAATAGPVRIELAPGRYVLESSVYTDPSCGNCEDATESVPATLGLKVSGTGVEIVGTHADSVVIETRAGYGLLFEDCADCALRHVTVTGGVRSPDGRATDAAVVVRRSTVTLEACVLRDNVGDSAVVATTVVGIAGIAVREGGDATVRGCRIVGNSWDGIAMYRGARAHIVDNVVDGVDRAAGARIGGGRGVGIGLTWDAQAVIERNLVRRYWKGIGAFVTADADIRENVVEDILTWGIALWGPGGAHPAARIERNIVFRTGACGVMIERPVGGGPPGTLIDNIIVQTGGNDAYDRGEPYCWQRPIARHSVPPEFVERGNLLAGSRQPVDAGTAPAPLPELTADALARAARPLEEYLAGQPALRGATVFSAQRELAPVLRPHASTWQRVLAAEDARAVSDGELSVLFDALTAAEPELRRLAVRALGRLERADLAPRIAPMLADAAPRVRASAANALAQTLRRGADERAAELLLDALPAREDDPHAVAAIAESVGRLRHADTDAARAVVERLVPHLIGTNEARLGALRGLYFTARQQSARGAFTDAALDALRRQVIVRSATAANDTRTRALAVATLVAAGGANAAVIDSVLSRDAAPLVRREAVAGAAALADAEQVSEVVQRGLSDSAAVVRYEALRVYGRRLADQGCRPITAAARDPDLHVALQAIELLAASCTGDADAIAVIRTAVSANAAAPDPRARRSAARALVALARTDRAAAAPALRRFVHDDDMFVRAYAARAAGVLADTATLRGMASDAQPIVRTAVVQSLSTTARAGRTADPIYLAQLDQDDGALLLAASAALAGSTAPRAADRLLDALDRVTAQRRETTRDARRALLDRARELGNASLAPRIQPYLRDFDATIAEQAGDVIASWTGTRVEPAPEPLPRLPLPTFDEVAALERAHVVVELDGGASFTIRLLPFDAPTNAARFARLARAGYYDGLTVHRVVPNFVVQGGSPGANEYSGDGPFTRDELGLAGNWRGAVGLSTRGRDTGDAQFYINLVDNVRLDHEYTVFGVVTDGMDVVDAMLEGVMIRRMTVRE
jgi:cyclophilin family peptidyl-prolyl cis-trans isomerase/HEAT repeat protein